MDGGSYQAFTDRLLHNLQQDSRVIGFVSAGSMANIVRRDRWSDHDFFVVVESGFQTEFRQNLQWLPDFERIVIAYQETDHGLKVIYEDGHLLEFAVFDMDELSFVKINDYEVLFDRSSVTQKLIGIAEKSGEQLPRPDEYYWGQFLAHLIVGLGRYFRGEKLSGHIFVKNHALNDILPLITRYLESPEKARLDNLDAPRRFEFVFPEIARTIDHILLLPVPDACLAYLDFATVNLGHIESFPQKGIQVVREYIEREMASL